MSKWDIRFLLVAHHIGQWSKDPSGKVGAVITVGNRMISSGYNGFPMNTDDNPEIYEDRPRKYKRIIHAEKNAIMFAKQDLSGCILYCTHPPCSQCAGMIVQCGIKRVVSIEPNDDFKSRWAEDFQESMSMFEESGIEYKEYPVSILIENQIGMFINKQ